jgi:RNA polymerase sigma-70 factor (ECF subfamily)
MHRPIPSFDRRRHQRHAAVPAVRAAAPDLEDAVLRMIDGDERAFAEIYRALRPRVLGLLVRLTGDRALAEELAQETFMRLHQARATCRRDADITPWVLAIARNVRCDHARRTRARRFSPGEDAGYERSLPQPAPPPDEALVARLVARGVDEVLASLPEGQVRAFRLVREEGKSLDEAAALLGRSELAVRLSVHRARAAIREHLADRWGITA